ncbi:MAG: hypothetical protein ACJ8KU_10850 [Chthoniobacterales bacterium]
MTTMHLRYLPIAAIAASLVSPIRAQTAKPATADELVAKNIEAHGGAAALQALTSVKASGKMLINDGRLQLGFVKMQKRPGEVRSEVSMQGMTAVQAYDGENGWKIMPFQGRKDPEKMSADDAKSLVEDAEIAGPLVNAKASGSTVEYLGTEEIDGTEAYKLKVTRKNGDVSFVYLDPDAFLEIRIITQRTEHGAQLEFQTDFGDYEKVGGVFLPFSIEESPRGAPDKQKTVIDSAEANVPVDDANFRFPASRISGAAK